MGKTSIKLIANNKKAYHDFFIEDTFEAGISLHGTEVKSLVWENAASRKPSSGLKTAKSSVYGHAYQPL